MFSTLPRGVIVHVEERRCSELGYYESFVEKRAVVELDDQFVGYHLAGFIVFSV